MRRHRRPRGMAAALALALALLMAALAGCSDATSSAPAYGGAQNHLHDILALRGEPGVVLLATHIGLYRSPDAGKTWREVAGGDKQVMDGLMLYKLAQSPVDPRRIYLLAVPRPDNPQAARDTPGVYTSADAGQTWTHAAPATTFGGNLFTIGAGSGGAGQVFVYVSSQGATGLYRSDDDGAHWQRLPALPDASIGGVMGDPSKPGRTLAWSIASGLYVSGDAGMSWARVPGVDGGIFSLARAGATLYANGDAGVYTSTDDGAHFALAEKELTFSQVVATDADPARAYAETGTDVYASRDGGRTWRQAAATSAHPGLIAADPSEAERAYVAFSYPLGVEVTADGGTSWSRALP